MLGGTRAALLAVVALTLVGMPACESPVGEQQTDGRRQVETAERTGGERPPTPVETVRLAYETTAEAETSKFSTRTVISGLPQQQGAPQSFVITGEGSGNLTNGNAEMVMQMPMLGRMEARYVGSTMYQRVTEPFAAEVPPGKEWISIDYEKMMREEYGTSLSSMEGGAQGAPSDQLAYLRGVSDSVEKLGTEEVRGVPTTHYRANVDLGKAAPEDPEARRAYEKMMEGLRTDEIPTEVWIDEKGRVRRYEMTMPFSLPEGSAPAAEEDPTMTMTAEYYDFGAPVEVQPPPADKTIPLEELMDRQQQQQYSPA